MSDTLVLAQIADGAVHDVSLQCVAKARSLADASGGKVSCLAVGSRVSEAAKCLFGYGADAVYAVEDARLEHYLTTPYKKALKAFLEVHPHPVVVLPATTVGNDLAPMAAAELRAACVMGCDDVRTEGDGTRTKRMEFDRKVFTSFSAPAGTTLVVTLKDGAAEAPAADASKQGDVQAFDAQLADTDFVAKVLHRDVATKSVNLKDAKIIVAAGAGLGNEENFGKVRELAGKLGAELGATRAVVDAGWLPADHQIGQTGATVRPDVYMACGISGAVQHWVGMSESKTIVAINIDKAAPILKRAHYRIVGDVNAVIPKLLKVLA